MNILIAEDQNVIKLLLELALSEWGYDCDMVSNGLEAVEYAIVNQGKYDLCIMDISMPVMDGIEATRVIREQAGYFPILGYSSDIAMQEQCLDAGMDGFLLKPCSREKILEMIKYLAK